MEHFVLFANFGVYARPLVDMPSEAAANLKQESLTFTVAKGHGLL